MSKDDDSPKEIQARWAGYVFPDRSMIPAKLLYDAIKDLRTLLSLVRVFVHEHKKLQAKIDDLEQTLESERYHHQDVISQMDS